MVAFTLDGKRVPPGGRAARARRRSARHLHPDSLPRRQARTLRRLPHVPRRPRGRAAARSGLRAAGARGHGRLDERQHGHAAKTLTEMLLAEHLAPNPAGRPNELIDLAEELGAQAPFLLPDAGREPYDDRNRLMGYEPDACILCNRCVRYTQEVMQCSALTFEGRGAEARVVPTHGHSWLDTECELCGGCLSVCPTGAIHEQFLAGAPEGHERGAREDEDDVHVLRRRLPDRPQRRPGDEADRQGHVRPRLRLERRQPLRQGPLRLQLRPPSGPSDAAAGARRRRRPHPTDWDTALGPRHRDCPACATRMARSRSASSRRRG